MNSDLHRVWRIGSDVDTDALAPGTWMQHGVDVMSQRVLANSPADA